MDLETIKPSWVAKVNLQKTIDKTHTYRYKDRKEHPKKYKITIKKIDFFFRTHPFPRMLDKRS